MSRLRGISVKQLRADQPISESDIQLVAAKEKRNVVAGTFFGAEEFNSCGK